MRNRKIGYDLANQYYKSQEKSRDSDFQKALKIKSESWLENKTIDSWRHLRMYFFTDPLTKAVPNAFWLTVGDGSYGKDAHYLEEHGADVLATDIDDRLLKVAKRQGYIKKYQRENAEKLSFRNNSFDFVFCKESYHHFPRPMIALYEMLRVAKKAVILIEPNDVKRRGFSWSRFWSVDLPGTQVNGFEISGNYVYQISRREMEKVALGIGLPMVAFNGFDDIYIKEAGGDKIEDNTFDFKKTKAILWLLEMAYKLGIRDRSLLVAIIFKEKPKAGIIEELKLFGYDIRALLKNPYI